MVVTSSQLRNEALACRDVEGRKAKRIIDERLALEARR